MQGRVNRIWNASSGRLEIGSFGFKSNNASRLDQIAAPMAGDLGLTSRAYPAQSCTPAETASRVAPGGRRPGTERGPAGGHRLLPDASAATDQACSGSPTVRRGERHFHALGCAACHRPHLRTAADATYPPLRNRQIEPYTDLLLRDMGEGLADGRPEHLGRPPATGAPRRYGDSGEYRPETPPAFSTTAAPAA